MIRITPYYERRNKQKILTCYLNLVADATPFRPEDVLAGVEKSRDSLSDTPRRRNSSYRKLLKDLLKKKEMKELSCRDQDALAAQRIIKAYSKKLHDELYNNPSSNKPGAVNRDALRRLLTTTFSHGKVPDALRFFEHRKGSAALLRDNVFRYDVFSEKRLEGKRSVYQLLSMLGVSVCPYCNRQYITTVAHGRQSVRPQIDHFNNKKDFPYLALSINNLIPSCGVCNLQKSDKKDEILYPYDEELGDNFVFRAEYIDKHITSLLQGADDAMETFRINLNQNGNNLDQKYVNRARNSISVLALDQLYQSHKDYVSGLFFQRYIFTDDYFASTTAQFPKLFKTAEDVKHVLRLMDYSPGAWGNRPLAKLTHDIAEQIDKLYLEKST